jgi:RNA polymerase sigma factor (sigma-70 family)
MEARIRTDEAARTADEAARAADEAAQLRRAVAGDRAALEDVAREWRTRIRRWALLELGDPALAEDACQDTFVQLIRHVSKYDPERPFGPWLRTIVRNCCHRARRGQVRHVHEELDDTHLRAIPEPEHAMDVGRATAKAVETFGALTPRQRELMHLCTQDGLSAAEAARELGISPSTARVLMFRARQTLLAAVEAK